MTMAALEGRTVVCQGLELTLRVAAYGNGRPAVVAMFLDGVEPPYCKLTVNLVERDVADGCFFVKLGGEAHELAARLVRAGVLEDTGAIVGAGLVEKYAGVFGLVDAEAWAEGSVEERAAAAAEEAAELVEELGDG